MFDRGIPLSALLGAGSTAPDPVDRRGIPEAQVERLREVFARAAQLNPFAPGDLVMPRSDAAVGDAGAPHIVLDVIEPVMPSFRTDACCGEKRFDMRLAYVDRRGDIRSLWAEAWGWEPWSPAPAASADVAPRPAAPAEAGIGAAA